MAKVGRYIQEGNIINVTVGSDVAGGDPVDFGTRIGLASTGALSGELVALQIEGVFEFTAVTGDTIALGDKIYLDNASGTDATTTSTSNQTIGYAVTEKAGGVAGTVRVKLGV